MCTIICNSICKLFFWNEIKMLIQQIWIWYLNLINLMRLINNCEIYLIFNNCNNICWIKNVDNIFVIHLPVENQVRLIGVWNVKNTIFLHVNYAGNLNEQAVLLYDHHLTVLMRHHVILEDFVVVVPSLYTHSENIFFFYLFQL